MTMHPKPNLPAEQFHDWYNNEHGPTRLRLPFIPNGFRYRATDGLEPEFVALYDITDMAELTTDTYTSLRTPAVKSQREIDTMAQIAVDRKLYDHIGEWVSPNFKKLEDISAVGKGNVLVSVISRVHPDKTEDFNKWYVEEHVPLLQKVPGWLRTRRFVTSYIDEGEPTEFIALHEYTPENGLGGPEFQAATTTPWTKEINSTAVTAKKRRVYSLYYTFGPVPRDLTPLSKPGLSAFTSPDKQTKTFPDELPAIESYLTTKDGAVIPYRLEGSTDPEAPLIVLVNSVLVEWGIWDDFVKSFFSQPQNKKYRILRYHSRGRYNNTGSQSVTVDLLASDIISFLDAFRVPKAALLMGVSLGGATVLNAALKYPTRVAAFVSCDTNASSPAGNSKAWGDRIAISEKEGKKDAATGEPIVGEELAQVTTRRWFVKESYDGGVLEATLGKVNDMVIRNSLEGFRKGVRALFEYDLREEMKSATVKGSFLVGSGDGILPEGMKKMAAEYAGPSDFKVISGAGHLPMVEKPEEVAQYVTAFLAN